MEIDYSSYKILVVDDIEPNIILLKVLLEKVGFKIVSTQRAEEVINLVEEEKPDLILLDVLMPVMNGFEVAKQLKGIENYKDIPIIFLTALDNSENIIECFKIGGSDYITKPFNKDELMARVKYQISLIIAKRTIIAKTEELKRIIISRDKMYSVIAHDLRSPMASIKMITNLLSLSLSEDKVGKDLYEMVRTANQTTEDIFSLLDNLLKWTKSQTGNLIPMPQPLDIVQIVKGICEIYATVASLKNIKFEIDTISNAEVSTDIDMFSTCVRNLLSNAIKFSYSDNIIRVSVTEEANQYIISVKDAGCGMDEENAKKLLHTDTHFSTYGTNQEEGSGLGLLLVKDFINKNGGELWFESELHKGSVFHLSVPRTSSNL